MKQKTKALARQILKTLGIGITSYTKLEELKRLGRSHSNLEAVLQKRWPAWDIELLSRLPDEQIPFFIKNVIKKSASQLGQEIFVLSELGLKKNGYFVEFGAADGMMFSNTYLLEKEFGWGGIVAEPAKCWHEKLRKNRSCHIETRCVWKNSDSILVFNETDDPEFSTINKYRSNDLHKERRREGISYDVRTISLLDLLESYGAPRDIDYLSIDTEGSEYEILSNFDFGKFEFKVITCEHNNTPMREEIHALLTSQGYHRKFEDISRFDDWYVRAYPNLQQL